MSASDAVKSEMLNQFFKLNSQLPQGASFSDIRRKQKIYVDKTEFIYWMVYTSQATLFTRPRHFGKSTVVSAIHELFEHGVEPYDGHDSYFAGLKIAERWTEKPGQYPVIHLNFSVNVEKYLSSSSAFQLFICRQIKQEAARNNHAIDTAKDNLLHVFFELLYNWPYKEQRLVLLVDEYDYPLTHCSEKAFADIYGVFRQFFNIIKSDQGHFHRIFITGVTRYRDEYDFLVGSNIRDDSDSFITSMLCGYTREEIRHYFREHLTYAVSVRKEKAMSDVTDADREKLLDELELWYSGYSFDGDAKHRVFNPWSVREFFNDTNASLQNYWFDSRIFPDVLSKAILSRALSMPDEISPDRVTPSSMFYLQTDVYLQKMSYSVLLLQTGYLTFAQAPESTHISLYFPNQEIKGCYGRLLIAALISTKTIHKHHLEVGQTDPARLSEFVEPEQFAEHLNLMVSLCACDKDIFVKEKAVQGFIHAYIAGGNYPCREEDNELTADFPSCRLVVVFRFAPVGTDDNAQDALLQQAVSQIKERDYGHTPDRSQSRLIRLALVYSQEQKSFSRWQAEVLPY